MYQQSIQFFWPLTEQIPLDLDYTNCEKPTLTVGQPTGPTFYTNGTTAATWVAMEINPQRLSIDVEEVIFKQRKQPSLLRRIVYKIIGLKWEMR